MIEIFKLQDNTHIRYEVIGKGQPLLLLHTFRNRLEYSYGIAKLLKKHYKLYILDLPGFGDSPINIKTKYSPDFFSECMVQFIKHKNIKKLSIAGESIGGVLPIKIAHRIPERIKQIFLFNPYDYDTYFGEGVSRANLFAKFIIFNISLPIAGSFFSSLENKFILKNIMKGGIVERKNLSNEYLNLLCTSIKKKGYTYHFRNVLSFSKSWAATKKIYKEINVPTKLIYGEFDWASSFNKSETRKLLRLKSYYTIKNCGHFSFLDNPEEVSKIILDNK